MTIADRDRLTAMVLEDLIAGMGQRDYPGGPTGLLADFLVSWGIPAGKRNLANILCDHRRKARECSLSELTRRKL